MSEWSKYLPPANFNLHTLVNNRYQPLSFNATSNPNSSSSQFPSGHDTSTTLNEVWMRSRLGDGQKRAEGRGLHHMHQKNDRNGRRRQNSASASQAGSSTEAVVRKDDRIVNAINRVLESKETIPLPQLKEEVIAKLSKTSPLVASSLRHNFEQALQQKIQEGKIPGFIKPFVINSSFGSSASVNSSRAPTPCTSPRPDRTRPQGEDEASSRALRPSLSSTSRADKTDRARPDLRVTWSEETVVHDHLEITQDTAVNRSSKSDMEHMWKSVSRSPERAGRIVKVPRDVLHRRTLLLTHAFHHIMRVQQRWMPPIWTETMDRLMPSFHDSSQTDQGHRPDLPEWLETSRSLFDSMWSNSFRKSHMLAYVLYRIFTENDNEPFTFIRLESLITEVLEVCFEHHFPPQSSAIFEEFSASKSRLFYSGIILCVGRTEEGNMLVMPHPLLLFFEYVQFRSNSVAARLFQLLLREEGHSLDLSQILTTIDCNRSEILEEVRNNPELFHLNREGNVLAMNNYNHVLPFIY